MSFTKQQLIENAAEMLSLGLNILPVGRDKKGAIKKPEIDTWTKYQKEVITLEEISRLIKTRAVLGLIVVCGKTSGGFEVLDIDTKNCEGADTEDGDKIKRAFWEAFRTKLEEDAPELKSKLVAAVTPSGGFHIYYRAPITKTDNKIARTKPKDGKKSDVLIETKGQGGLSGFPTVPGYRFLNGAQASDIPTITEAERETLHAVARSFNQDETLKAQKPALDISAMTGKRRARAIGSPFDDFNGREDIFEMVASYGWKAVRRTADGARMQRPGKTKNESQGEIKGGRFGGRFLVFSDSRPFEAGKVYSAADVFALGRGIDPHTDAGRRDLAEILKAEGYGF
jgi:hypothetical protein